MKIPEQPQLRKLILEGIIDYHSRGFQSLSGDELYRYISRRVGFIDFTDLWNIVDNLNIDNSGNKFEEKVVNPIKRAQGIYD